MNRINLKKTAFYSFILACNFIFISESIIAQNQEVNIALSKWGTTATAGSYQKGYEPECAIDGKWTTKEDGIGRKFLWNSESDKDKYWLVLDFGIERNIHKITIRHEGTFASESHLNTSDFSLQYAESKDGPWSNLTLPVVNNKLDVSVHEFNPAKTRYVRLWIDKGEQKANSWARIHEVEVYASLSKDEFLVASKLEPNSLRMGKKEEEVKFELELFPQKSFKTKSKLIIKSENFEKVLSKKDFKRSDHTEKSAVELWLPLSEIKKPLEIETVQSGRKTLVSMLPAMYSKVNRWDYIANGEVNIVCSSHNDIAWFDTPDKTAEFRDKDAITPALHRMKNRDDVYFSMENVLYLDEYMERKPQNFQEIKRLSASGHLDWGATYNQPYESLLSSEQLVRQVYHGAKKIRKMIPGTTARVAYNVDVPGRAIQMPQILAKANVPYLVLSRHERGLFNWESPDGSSIMCWSMGHYYDMHHLPTHDETNDFVKSINEKTIVWESIYKKYNLPPVNGVLYSADYVPPADFDKFIEEINLSAKEMKEKGVNVDSPYFPPHFKYTSSEQFMDKIANSDKQLKTIRGERPNVWLYIHGPTHHKAISSKRKAGVLLPAAESFTTINSVLEGSFAGYPQQKFDEAWAASIYDDHGWGGNNGHVTDSVFKAKLDFAKKQGQKMLDDALESLTEKINTNDQKGEAIVLFNALSWERTDPVTVKIRTKNNKFGIIDHNGNKIDHQIIEAGNGEYTVKFIAENIPSLGYKTYYVSKSNKSKNSVAKTVLDNQYENDFYSIEFGKGGLKQILDKEFGKELIRPNKFQAGEIFTMQSIGNGAGEFWDVQKPDMEGFDKVSLHKPEWKLVENGAVFAKYELEQQLKNCTVKEYIIIYHRLKRIDCEVSLLGWDGTKNREFRMALPLKMDDAQVTYEVPMGTVTIGEDEMEGPAGWSYWPECKNTHPREVQNFISTNNQEFGITMSSSVAVFDHIDPTEFPTAFPIIQPVLLASRKSCHWLGNWYLQEGDHHYSFSIFSHEAGWENGYKQAIQANNPLLPVNSENKKAELPAEKSFFSVSQPNTLVSTVKKCDDDDNVVIRLYDIEGKNSQVEVNTFFNIKNAERTNIIEENGTAIPAHDESLKTKVGHHAIETYMLTPEL